MRERKAEQLQLIANQMLKGTKGKFPANTSMEDREAFLEKHRKLIEIVYSRVPRSSAAVSAVLCKCALKYNLEIVLRLADVLQTGSFRGQTDPAFLLWTYLLKVKSKTANQIYKITTTAARAYCEGLELNELKPSKKDVIVDE